MEAIKFILDKERKIIFYEKQRCFLRSLRIEKIKSLNGKIKLSWFINIQGQVSNLMIDQETIRTPRIRNCIFYEINQLTFPFLSQNILIIATLNFKYWESRGMLLDIELGKNIVLKGIHEAINEGKNIKKIKSFLNLDISVNSKDRSGNTPLHLAVSKGDLEIISLLIKSKADVNLKNKEKDTPLHLAVSKGDLEIISLLIKNKADVNSENEGKDTPLHLAISKGDLEIISLLIKNKADVNSENEGKDTPLHIAASKDALKIIILAYKKWG